MKDEEMNVIVIMNLVSQHDFFGILCVILRSNVFSAIQTHKALFALKKHYLSSIVIIYWAEITTLLHKTNSDNKNQDQYSITLNAK